MSTSSSNPVRFFAFLAGWVALAWILATASAVALDVLGLGRAAGHMHRSACGEQICASQRWWKPVAFARSGARTVLLGDSRVVLGIDPADVAPSGAAFNLAIAGSGFDENAGTALALMRQGRVDHLIMALDRAAFARPALQTAPPALADQVPGAASIVATYATSRAAFRAAIDIVHTGSCCKVTAGRASDGCLRPLRMGLVRMSEGELDSWLLGIAAGCAGPDCGTSNDARNLDILRRVVEMAARTRTRLTLFTNPVPAATMDLVWRVLPDPDVGQWKRDLARVVEQAGGGWVAPPRDFAIFSPETASGAVSQDASDLEPGFHDFLHYTHGMGRLVLGSLASEATDHGFGASLGKGLDRQVEADQDARDRWIRSHPAEVALNERRTAALRPLFADSRTR